jgi:peroxiredoxin
MLSDVDREVGAIYETRRHAEESSPEYAKRRTYLIDPEGVIRRAYRVSDIPAHPDEVLEDLRRLQSGG